MTDTPQPGAADAASVTIVASTLVPNLTALVRWLMQGLGVWLVAHGMTAARAADLTAILTGLALSGGAIGWSWVQKRLAADRIKLAARTAPASVVLK